MTPHSPTVHCFSGMVMVWLVSLTVEIIARQSVRVSGDFMRGWEAEDSPGTTSTIFCLAEYLCRLKRLAALSDLRLWGEQTLSEMIIFSENHYRFSTNQSFQSTNRIVRWWISTNTKNFSKNLSKEKLLPNIFGQVDLKYFSGRLLHRFLLAVFVRLSDTKKRKSLKVWNGTVSAELLSPRCHSLSHVNNKEEVTPCFNVADVNQKILWNWLPQRNN